MATYKHPDIEGTYVDDMNENFSTYNSSGNPEYSSTGSTGNTTGMAAVITIDAKELKHSAGAIDISGGKYEVFTLAGGSKPVQHNGYGSHLEFTQSNHSGGTGHNTISHISFTWTVTKELALSLNNKVGDLHGLTVLVEYTNDGTTITGHDLQGANLRLDHEIRADFSDDQTTATLFVAGFFISPAPTKSEHRWNVKVPAVDKFNNLPASK
jgi:hypothetical protein